MASPDAAATAAAATAAAATPVDAGAGDIVPGGTYQLVVRNVPGKGRGVFAPVVVPRGVVIDVSPVLVFDSVSYAEHGRHTALDHYTFHWFDGACALALGMGSMFNHAATPNVGFMRDRARQCIVFSTLRRVAAGEELCISYGIPERLWFQCVEGADAEGAVAVPCGCECHDHDDDGVWRVACCSCSAGRGTSSAGNGTLSDDDDVDDPLSGIGAGDVFQ